MSSNALAVKEDWTVAFLKALRQMGGDKGRALTSLKIDWDTYHVRLGEQAFREAVDRTWRESAAQVEDHVLRTAQGLKPNGKQSKEYSSAAVKAQELILKAVKPEVYGAKGVEESERRFATIADMFRFAADSNAPTIEAEVVKNDGEN